MKKYKVGVLALMAFGLSATTASATSDLYEYAFNIDGTVSEISLGDPIPAGVNVSGFNDVTGLGTIIYTPSGGGTHSFLAFFDHEIDQSINTFFNESGDVTGSTPGQSWEIDEPGYVFGDIYDNFVYNTLDKTNAVPAGLEDDVSWAMGWNFTLGALDTAVITLSLTDVAPLSGFYLTQFDPDSNESIFFAGSLDIRPIPEPATMLLMGTGLAGLLGFRRKKKRA